jgi:hypothetical protein
VTLKQTWAPASEVRGKENKAFFFLLDRGLNDDIDGVYLENLCKWSTGMWMWKKCLEFLTKRFEISDKNVQRAKDEKRKPKNLDLHPIKQQ